MTRLRKYLEEAVTSAKVANYDKKIGDKGNTSNDSITLSVKDESFVSKVKEIAKKYNLSISRDGDTITLTGETSDIRQAEEELKSAGAE